MIDAELASRSKMPTRGSSGMCGSGNAQMDQRLHQLRKQRLGTNSFQSTSLILHSSFHTWAWREALLTQERTPRAIPQRVTSDTLILSTTSPLLKQAIVCQSLISLTRYPFAAFVLL